MKTIGIIGGLGPPSTVKYYEGLVYGANRLLGGQNAARIILSSVNGEDVRRLRQEGDAAAEGAFYAREAQRLERAGADFLLIASNTSHKNAPYVEAAVSIPLLHLADATANAVTAGGSRRVGLIATALTMEEDFYKSRLIAAGLAVLIPEADDRALINRAIYDELVLNRVLAETNAAFLRVIADLKTQGAEAVILGCTELTLLDLKTAPLPLFDTVQIHIDAALRHALGTGG
jgi:aspartate racemase